MPDTPYGWNSAWNRPFSYPQPGTMPGRGATSTSASGSNPALAAAIQRLITPGLVPDIARMGAEVAAGRGIAGSPAAESTAVKMSEQNYLQRLGLANQLLSGEASRTLPYQITPYQALALQNQRRSGTGGASFNPGSSRLASGGSGLTYPFANFNGFGLGASPGVLDSGPSGLGRTPTTLDDIYEELGFADFGAIPGDSSSGFPEFNPSPDQGLTNWEWDFMPPDQGDLGQ